VSTACLNCGAPLHGVFCSACGQRKVPANPTLKELAGHAWEELSGYDGRFARTCIMLLRHPGRLTNEFIEGRRARYIKPVRLYLVASVAYFLVAALAPVPPTRPKPVLPGKGKVTIDLFGAGVAGMSPEERDNVVRSLERAPWWLKPLLNRVVYDPAKFRQEILAALPRVLFVLVPVFAAIVAIFYRRRFAHHLVFALHLHAAIFIGFAISRLAAFAGSAWLSAATGVIVMLLLVWYSLRAFHDGYGGSWPMIVIKSAGVTALYLVAGLGAMVATLAWASLAA
jgi:hypothetical protein